MTHGRKRFDRFVNMRKYLRTNNFHLAPLRVRRPEETMPGNLTKRDIVLAIYEKANFPQKEVRDTVQMALDVIAQALAQGRNVELRNFGVFEVQVRQSRVGRNPNKPEKDVIIPRRAVIKFKAGKELKAELKKLDLNSLTPGSPGV